MFDVNGTTITMSRGDTGAMKLTANVTRKDTGEPYVFGERDRALFSIKGGNQLVKQKSYPLVNNQFTVVFMNADTDQLNPGGYTWDVRYIINPYYNDDMPEPPEGQESWTPYDEITFPVGLGYGCKHGGTYYIAAQAIESSEDWTPAHWLFADYRIPVDGDQIITPKNPMSMSLLTIVGEI